MVFVANKNYSYACNESPVVVYNTGGRILFSRPNKSRKLVVFNLPDNTAVKTQNRLIRVSKNKNRVPSFDELFRMYPKQNSYTLPKKGELKIVLGVNRNKASIYPTRHTIICDKNLFATMPLPSIKFILFHEIGHYFYEDEDLTDLFATVCMLKNGYSYYDCLQTQLNYFGRNKANLQRVLFIYNKLKNYENR